MTEKEKMLAGELYFANDPLLAAERVRAKTLCRRYNAGEAHLLRELFGYDTDAYLEPPFFCDYGTNVELGSRVYANHNLIVLDCARVKIGSDVFMGPNVVLSTAGHPIDPAVRTTQIEFAKPITIEDGVWIGANVVVLPGVTIGAGATIGAGSVVTRDVPGRVVAVGSPCRVIRRAG